MKKKTKKKLISILIKTLLSMGLVFGIVLPIIILFLNNENLKTFFYSCPFIATIIGIIAFVLLFKFPEALERPKTKAHEFPLNISNFDDFIKYLDNNMSKIGYEKFPYLNNYNELACVYYKKTRDNLEYYTVYHFDEIKETKAKTFDLIENLSEKFLDRYYQTQDSLRENDLLSDTCIIWVDKENKNFKDIVNINLANYYGLLMIGMSPSKRIIYVSDYKEGSNKFVYWNFRKKFFKVMKLKMKDKIENNKVKGV